MSAGLKPSIYTMGIASLLPSAFSGSEPLLWRPLPLACTGSVHSRRFTDAVSASTLAMHTDTGLRLASTLALTMLPSDLHRHWERTTSPHEPMIKPAPDALRITQLCSHQLSLHRVLVALAIGTVTDSRPMSTLAMGTPTDGRLMDAQAVGTLTRTCWQRGHSVNKDLSSRQPWA